MEETKHHVKQVNTFLLCVVSNCIGPVGKLHFFIKIILLNMDICYCKWYKYVTLHTRTHARTHACTLFIYTVLRF